MAQFLLHARIQMADSTPIVDIRVPIYVVRGVRVVLDRDLAERFGVTTKRLNQQVRRNQDRFPADFGFSLTNQEVAGLRLQFATSNKERGGARYLPQVFTEHGVLMAANVLNSPIAVRASIEIVREFVRIREWMTENRTLVRKLDALERKYDAQFKSVFDAIRELMNPNITPRKQIGFK